MGNEAKCILRVGRNRYEGKALLETSELLFRGAEYRVKVAFSQIRSVTAKEGSLQVETKDETLTFDGLAANAEKWREKILHPKTRIEKLGVKAGTRVTVTGELDALFFKELKQTAAQVAKDGDAAIIFLGLSIKGGAGPVAAAAKKLKGAASLWVVYPKGQKELTESDVIAAGREAGLKDIKVVGFSPTHTALKFVIPVASR